MEGHKSHIFVTVGSKEKGQYLIDTYDDFITCVDLILNTLWSDYMDSNFKCSEIGGKIVDLSITFKKLQKLFQQISNAIENGNLNLIPITEYSNLNIKEAIEYK
ncbi:hypothetical protein ACTA71_008016 [Dictyostelium dimigraforme]